MKGIILPCKKSTNDKDKKFLKQKREYFSNEILPFVYILHSLTAWNSHPYYRSRIRLWNERDCTFQSLGGKFGQI